MNKPIVYACLTLAWITVSVSPMAARESTDVVIMKNGDKITGEIKGLHDGSLAISLDYVDGTVSLQWSKVARLESTQPFIVETQAGPVYSGVLSTAESDPSHPIELQITETVQKPVVIEALQIVRIEQSSPKFWKRLNGAITFGINYSKGNQATQYSFGTEGDYVRKRWALQGSFNSNLSSNTGADTSTRNQLNASGYHLLRWDNYFYQGIGSFLQSSTQGIDSQATLGGGIGRFIKKSDRVNFALLGGMAWQNTVYQQSAVSTSPQNATAALIAAQFKFFRFKKTNLSVTALALPVLSELGRFRFQTNASYYLKLFSNLSWDITFYGNWDNRPPPTFSGSDYGSSSGLRWTFGNK